MEDAKNVIAYCNKYQDSLKIDTTKIAIFGHSMGAFVCLKVLEQVPQIKKGFALSTATVYPRIKPIPDEKILIEAINKFFPTDYTALNSTNVEAFLAAYRNIEYYNLAKDTKLLKNKQIIMLDEHNENKSIADAIRLSGTKSFDYQVWNTDHSFTNKRVSLINLLLAFLDK